MDGLGFTAAELTTIACACAALRFQAYSPAYLQSYLAVRLAADRPKLAAMVRGLSAEQMEQLCEWLHEQSAVSA